MLHVFYLDVAYVSRICYKCMFQMFLLCQTYVASSVSYFRGMLGESRGAHLQAENGAGVGGPTCRLAGRVVRPVRAVPACARETKRASPSRWGVRHKASAGVGLDVLALALPINKNNVFYRIDCQLPTHL
jgi:hypothetical protein